MAKHIQKISDTSHYFEITFTDETAQTFTQRFAPRPPNSHQMRYADQCLLAGDPLAPPVPPVEAKPVPEDVPMNDPPVIDPLPLTETEIGTAEVITDDPNSDFVHETYNRKKRK